MLHLLYRSVLLQSPATAHLPGIKTQHPRCSYGPPQKTTRYCECFASGRYCDGCNCVGCCNNQQNEGVRQSAVEAILDRNPNAFRPKIAGDVVGFLGGKGG